MARTKQADAYAAIIGALEAAADFDQLKRSAERLRDFFAVDHLSYHWVSDRGKTYACGTYDAAWTLNCCERGYFAMDPAAALCRGQLHPVDWRQLDWTSKSAQAFRREALAHGVGTQGISVPIRGRGGHMAIFVVTRNCDDMAWQKFWEASLRDVILAAHFFNQKALEIGPCQAPKPLRGLSPREVDAMTFLAMGFSRAQAADELSISEHTLRGYIESARRKLGAANTIHAVARALQGGLITL